MFAAMHESACGPKLNNAIADYMSAIGGRRDMAETTPTPSHGHALIHALALGE